MCGKHRQFNHLFGFVFAQSKTIGICAGMGVFADCDEKEAHGDAQSIDFIVFATPFSAN